MEWQRVSAPKTNEDPIPVFGGPIFEGKDKDGLYQFNIPKGEKQISCLDNFMLNAVQIIY